MTDNIVDPAVESSLMCLTLYQTVLTLVIVTIIIVLSIPLIQLQVLFHIAKRGAQTRKIFGFMYAYCVQTDRLDDVSIHELLVLAHEMVDVNSASEVELFHKYVLSFKYVLIFRERMDGSLRGMFLISKETGTSHAGVQFTLIKTGLALFKEKYRGGPLMYLAFMYFYLKELVYHPFTPLYGVFKCFSVKSYLLARRNFAEVWPRYNVETPAWEKSLIDNFGFKTATDKETYDPVHCVINREITSLKNGIAPIREEDMSDPDVKFFANSNPDWQMGHLLVVLYRVNWICVWIAIKRTIKKALQVRKQVKNEKRKPAMLHRQNTLFENITERKVHLVDPLSSCSLIHEGLNPLKSENLFEKVKIA